MSVVGFNKETNIPVGYLPIPLIERRYDNLRTIFSVRLTLDDQSNFSFQFPLCMKLVKFK